MSTTSQASGVSTEEEISVEQIKRETLNRRIEAARSLAERMQEAPDGSRVFVRFSLSQRLEHLILMVSFATLAVTGLLQTFSFLPPIAAALAILTWHMYHGCIKDRNRSIFTGLMSEEEMMHMHPLEYQRILAADEYFKRIAEVNGAAGETVERDKVGIGAAPSPGS